MRKLTTEEFKRRANLIHNNFYNYLKSEYKGIGKKLIITCPNHGDFEQRPGDHIHGKQGCPICYSENRVSDTTTFINKAISIHGNFYDYSLVNYINSTDKVIIICPVHGEFLQKPNNHISGFGCWECRNEKISETKISSIDEFIVKARLVHGDEYDYSKSVYIGNHDNLEILCNFHGSFYQMPSNHISGNGCPKCKNFLSSFISIENLEIDKVNSKKETKLYLILLFNNDEKFLKIGITTNSISRRYRGLSEYNYSVLEVLSTTLLDARKKELSILKDFENFKYEPKIKFAGHTECLNLTSYNDVIKRLVI